MKNFNDYEDLLLGPGKSKALNNATDKDAEIVEIEENTVYFYAEIYRDKILKLNKALRKKDNTHVSKKYIMRKKYIDPIYLHINSFGGSIFAGLSGMDSILTCKSPIITVVDGICASAATFLSVVGTKRLINRNSHMLIHQLSSGTWGKYEELKDQMENVDKLMATIKNIYLKYTKIPKVELDCILKRDLYFDAEESLKFGLVDAII